MSAASAAPPAERALALHDHRQPIAAMLDVLGKGTSQDWLECAQGLVLRRAPAAALQLIEAAVARHPDDPELHFARAGLLLQTGQPRLAETSLCRLLDQHPDHGGAAFLLAGLLRDDGRNQAMAGVFRRHFAHAQPDADRALRAIEMLQAAGRLQDALAVCGTLLASHGRDVRLHVHAGTLLSQLGRFDEARTHLLFALDQPELAMGWHVPLALTEVQRYADRSHPDFPMLEGLLRPDLDPHARTGLLFALGKAHDDIGEYAQAARYLREANALMQARTRWSRKAFRRSVEARLARRLPPIPARPAQGWAPLLVVGMPRSGSTLLAELLARHPDICLRGELPWLPTLTAGIDAGSAGFASQLEQATRRYAAQLRQDDEASARARWFIDKQPHNDMDLDLTLAMFPQARIIHCTRSARGNALSLWMQSFHAGTQDFAYDFADIAAAIQGSRRLMRHWSQRYPHAIRTVRYEDLVGAPEQCISGLLDWLDLPARDLLHAPRAGTAISTASLWQARQPVHGRSIARWRHYEDLLPELRALPD